MKNLDELKLTADTLLSMANDENNSKEERQHYRDQAIDIYKMIDKLENENKMSMKDKILLTIQILGIVVPFAGQILWQSQQTKLFRESLEFEKTGTVTTAIGKSILKNISMPFKK